MAALGDEAGPRQLPATVRAAIAARIDALPPDARTALLHASVIGQSFWRGVLGEIGELGDVGDALEALEARGLVRRHPQSQVEGDVEFAFKHVLIRDVAYATLPRALRRRELHARRARVIEDVAPDPAELALGPRVPLARGGRAGAGDRVPARGRIGARRRASDRGDVGLATRGRSTSRTTDAERRGDPAKRGAGAGRRSRSTPAQTRSSASWSRSSTAATWSRRSSPGHGRRTGPRTAEETIEIAHRAPSSSRSATGANELLPPALGAAERRPTRCAARRATCNGRSRRGSAGWGGPRDADGGWPSGTTCRPTTCTGWGATRALELSRLEVEASGDPQSAEFVLRGAGMKGLVLSGLGRYEEALAAVGDRHRDRERDGPAGNVVTNYSTRPLRDIFALDEALERSSRSPTGSALGLQHAVDERPRRRDRRRPDPGRVRPRRGRLPGDLGRDERPGVGTVARQRAPLLEPRGARARHEAAGQALTWARRALEMARVSGRTKYEVVDK